MQQLKCTSCTTLNQPGETVCRECGASLIATSVVTPIATVAPVAAVVPVAHIAPVAPIVERAPVMIVDRGMSDQAKILTALFSIVGLVLIGVAFYAWSESNRSEDQLERARTERLGRPDRTAGIAAPVAAPAATPTVIVTPPAPTGSTTGPAPDVVAASHQEVAAYVSNAEPLLREWRNGVTFVESAEAAQIAQTVSTLRDLEGRIADLPTRAAGVGIHSRRMTAMRNMVIEITCGAAGRT